MKKLIAITLMLPALILAGCSKKIQYGDAQAVETTTIGFGSTDLQTIAASMVDDLGSFAPVVGQTAADSDSGGQRPVLFVDRIKNKTTEHIDTESITDSIQDRLLRSGKFRFVDMTAMEAAKKQFQFQNSSGLVDPAKAIAMGKYTGAQFMLYGNLSSIVKRDDDKQDVYYKFTLKLMNLESGFLEWSNEKEIRKTGENTFLGL